MSGTGSSDEHARAVYGPRAPAQDIVEMVCRIMDEDGPQPMRNLRPTQKYSNAAERFHSQHQGEYEAREWTARGGCDSVHLHNSGYPKMRDEIARRRSTGKVAPFTSHTQRACIKHHKKISSKPPSAASKKYRQKTKRPAISKSRRRPPCRQYRLSKLRTNRGCQCSTFLMGKDKMSGTTDNARVHDKMADGCQPLCSVAEGFGESLDFTHPSDTSQISNEGSGHSKPEPDPSVSSYNSYASLDQGPMVSN